MLGNDYCVYLTILFGIFKMNHQLYYSYLNMQFKNIRKIEKQTTVEL